MSGRVTHNRIDAFVCHGSLNGAAAKNSPLLRDKYRRAADFAILLIFRESSTRVLTDDHACDD